MIGRGLAAMAAVVVLGCGLVACDKIKGAMGGGPIDFRNAQIDVSGTPCSDNAKFSTLVLQDGKYELGQYQFELFGETKYGDVSGHTTTENTDASVFVGNCAINGQTSQVLFVYGPDSKRLGTASLTDNGAGLVQSFDVKDSTILVEQNQGNPPTLTKTSYALLNGKLADLSPAATPPVAPTAQANDIDIVSFQAFHDKLQPYGKWIDHPRWGKVWAPSAAGFRPYQNGHWEDSDEYGSVWVSDDPWGDSPYHYGRWGYDPNYGGWLWVPGYVWGPSWVVWRAGEDNIGWFPMPPGDYDGEGDYPDEYADWYGYRDLYGAAFDEAAFDALWSFVPAVDIFAGDVRTRIIDRRGYGRFIGRTRDWTRYGQVHGHVVSRAFERHRFESTFHRGLPGGMRHDFVARHVTPVAVGHRIAVHERVGAGDHGGGFSQHVHTTVSREGGMGGSHRAGMDGSVHTAGFHHEGGGVGGFHHTGMGETARTGGFHHDSGGMGGFHRSGTEGSVHTGYHRENEGGYARSGAYHTNGYAHSGGGQSGMGGYSRSGGGSTSGYSRGNGFSGGGFTRQNSGGFGGGMGNGGFGHSGGGTPRMSTPTRSAPAPSQHSGGGHHH